MRGASHHPADTLAERLRAEARRLRKDERSITLAGLAQLQGTALQGSLLILLSAPCLLPIPGMGNLMGTAMVLLSLTMWRGGDETALPPRVGAVALSPVWARRLLEMLAHCHELFGRWSRQRWTRLVQPSARFWTAPLVALMGVIIFLPVPLGNVLPACSLLALGCGLCARDGLAMMLAAALGLGSTAYAAALAFGMWSWIVEPLLSIWK
jgi:hypothetical protein